MNWIQNIARWRSLTPEAKFRLRWEAIPEDVAQSILGTLEGAMLVARPYGDVARFNATARHLVDTLST